MQSFELLIVRNVFNPYSLRLRATLDKSKEWGLILIASLKGMIFFELKRMKCNKASVPSLEIVLTCTFIVYTPKPRWNGLEKRHGTKVISDAL